MNDMDKIYDMYGRDIYKYLLKMTGNEDVAEELLQETFLRAVKQIDSFRGETSIKAWLIVISKNCYYSAMRSPWRKLIREGEESADGKTEDISDCFENKEEVRRLHRILHNLGEPYKEVFSLRVFGELPFKEIAELFGKTESWAKVTFYRAKSKIINKMNKEE